MIITKKKRPNQIKIPKNSALQLKKKKKMNVLINWVNYEISHPTQN